MTYLPRKDTQHVLLKMLIGSNYLGPVREILGSARKRSVLDVGCGSCSFVLDMAKEFPDAQVIGCDVAPMQRALAPPNLRIDIVSTW
jgi:methylase of polypeptide subunit release factors